MSKISGMALLNQAPQAASVLAIVEGGVSYRIAVEKLLENGDDSGGVEAASFADEKALGTDGGSSTAGSWLVRDINVLSSVSWASLATNQITLQAGTYCVFFGAPGLGTESHQIKLTNVTDTIDYLGQDAYNGAATTTFSFGLAVFVLVAAKVFEIRHRFGFGRATDGLGRAGDFGVEVYSQGGIIKLA